MAQRKYSLPLATADIPMLSKHVSRTEMAPQKGSGPDKQPPGILYAENVMPTAQGMSTVGFIDGVPASSITLGTDKVLGVRYVKGTTGAAGTPAMMLIKDSGKVNFSSLLNDEWRTEATLLTPTSNTDFLDNFTFSATLNSVTYIYDEVGSTTYTVFDIDGNSPARTAVTLTGAPAGINGLVASAGYLIVWTNTEIAWSSTIDPTDFTPSEVTGAGIGDVADAKGKILFCLPIAAGFLIYCADNIVAATYTGNSQYPFKLKEVSGSSGFSWSEETGLFTHASVGEYIRNINLVAYEASSELHYAYTSKGLVSVSTQRITPILPEVTDFLSGRIFEIYNSTTKQLSEVIASAIVKKKLTFLSSRYLILSYGMPDQTSTMVDELTHAVIYDIFLKKFGKIKLDHVDVIEAPHRAESADIGPEKFGICFLTADGAIKIMVSPPPSGATSGVLILGKLQHTATHLTELHEIEVESTFSGDSLTVNDNVSLDGNSISSTVVATETSEAARLTTYKLRTVGKSHSLVLEGEFALTELQVTYSLAGRR